MGDNPPENPPRETLDLGHSKGRLPRRIGRYTIQGVIASGGMGTVYKAVQENPRRAVAVKVMRTGVTSASELRRFEFEAQLLGRLRHPGIAQIYEAGTHEEDGVSVPYFAMEYIPRAKSLIEYANEKQLGARDRLDLFARVCEAVHHGHQKGIIHRDLKPVNILVGPNGNPRVIDFGVARATDSDMALTLQQTDVGQLVGTVQYMSPEQCEADPHDLDTRSDVYSLGIVLYELLTGQLPYQVDQAPIFEATRIIREQDPQRPSHVNARLRGDVETIVLKALEKDRDRRYQSAAELGQDIRRYLAGEAITARPASSVYQLKVLARRKKGLLTAVGAVALVLVAGAVVSSALWFRGRNLEVQAAELEARVSGAQDYLADIMSTLGVVYGDKVPVSRLLETYGKNIEERFADQPETEAEVRLKLAETYDYLTMFVASADAKQFTSAAEKHLNKALHIRRELYGDSDPRILETIEQTAGHMGKGFDLGRAETLRREALAIREATGDPHEAMVGRLHLADLLITRGKLEEADDLNRMALDHFETAYGPDSSTTRWARNQRAEISQIQGKHDEVIAHWAEALARARERDGDVGWYRRELADAHIDKGDLAGARDLFGDPVAIRSDSLRIRKWLMEPAELDPRAPTLLVFWESWCPFCQLALPVLERIRRQGDYALQVVGMTSLNGDIREDEARDFVKRNDLEYPHAVYEGKLFDDLGLGGYPVVLAVADGRVLWKGHPALISAGFLEGLARGGRGEF